MPKCLATMRPEAKYGKILMTSQQLEERSQRPEAGVATLETVLLHRAD